MRAISLPGIVDADEEGYDIRANVDDVPLQPLLEIVDAITAYAAIRNTESRLRLPRLEQGVADSHVAEPEAGIAWALPVAVAVCDTVAEEDDVLIRSQNHRRLSGFDLVWE